VFTPMTVQPRLQNSEEVSAGIAKAYPPLLRDAGIGGKTKVWIYVDEEGKAAKYQVNTTSGYNALDAAALKVASIMRFQPAQNQSQVVPVWIALDIVFKAEGDLRPQGASTPEEIRAFHAYDARTWTNAQLMERPVFTPYTTQPRLINATDVERAIAQTYPPLLRDAGIGGKAVVWFFVDETGKPMKLQIKETSGYDALDAAALKAAEAVRFAPAENQGRTVPVWISIPIVYAIK
jgi:TonB family protein